LPTENITLHFFKFDNSTLIPFNDNFDKLGYESLNIIENFGTLFYIIVLYIAMYFMLIPLYLISKISKIF
jgi:hypothetical protein